MSDPSLHVFDMPPESAGFPARGAWMIRRLMYDLDVTAVQGAGLVGNLGGESGLKAINEIAPLVPGSAGGFGWAQWTASRRTDFENWCQQNALSPTQDEANYGFLLEELRGSHAHDLAQLKKTTTVEAAVFTFEYFYERPANMYGDLPRREKLANEALAAFNAPAAIPPKPFKPIHLPVPVTPSEPIQIMPPPIVQPRPSAGSATIVTMASGGIAGFIVGTIYLLMAQSGTQFPDWWYLSLYAALHTLGAWFGHSKALQIAEAAEDKLLRRFQQS